MDWHIDAVRCQIYESPTIMCLLICPWLILTINNWNLLQSIKYTSKTGYKFELELFMCFIYPESIDLHFY